jgi:hypothetical protein
MPFGERTTITVIDRQPLPPIAARAAKQLALKVAESEPLKLVHAADFDVGGGVQRLMVLRALTVPDADCARVEFKYGNQLGIVFFFFRFDGELTATDAARIADKVKNSVDKYVGRAQRAVYMRMLKAAAAVDGRYRASALQDALAFITDDASSASTRAVDGELAEMLAAASCEEDLRDVVAARTAGRREAPRSETFEDFYECVQRRLQSMNPAAEQRRHNETMYLSQPCTMRQLHADAKCEMLNDKRTAKSAVPLMGAAFLAIGIFLSSLTNNQILAFLGALVVSALFMAVSWDLLTNLMPEGLKRVSEYLGMGYHFTNIGRGLVDTRDLIYYFSIIAFFLFVIVRSVQSRRWA